MLYIYFLGRGGFLGSWAAGRFWQPQRGDVIFAQGTEICKLLHYSLWGYFYAGPAGLL